MSTSDFSEYGLDNDALKSQASQISEVYKSMAVDVRQAFDVASVNDFILALNQVATEVKDVATRFSFLFGASAETEKMLKSICDISLRTSIQLPHLATGIENLFAADVPVPDITPIVSQLGVVSQGSEEVFSSLISTFSQISLAGTMLSEQFEYLVAMGFDPLAQISLTTGEQIDELTQKLLSTGIASQTLFSSLSSSINSGSNFGESVVSQNEGIEESISSLAYAMQELSAEIMSVGGTMESSLSTILTSWNGTFSSMSSILNEMILVQGSYTAALATLTAMEATYSAAVQTAEADNSSGVASQGLLYASTVALTIGTNLLSKALTSSPWGWVAIGVGLLMDGISQLIGYQSEATAAQEEFNNSLKSSGADIQSECIQAKYLFDQLKVTKEGTAEYNRIRDEIHSKWGKYLTNYNDEKTALNDIEAAQKKVTEEIIKAGKARSANRLLDKEADILAQEQMDAYDKIKNIVATKFRDKPNDAKNILSAASDVIFNGADVNEKMGIYYKKFSRKLGRGFKNAMSEAEAANANFNSKSKIISENFKLDDTEIVVNNNNEKNKENIKREEENRAKAINMNIKNASMKCEDEMFEYSKKISESKIKQIELERDHKIKKIEDEKIAFVKENGAGASVKSFDLRIEVVQNEAVTQIDKVRESYEKLSKNIEEKRLTIEFDMEVTDLSNAIDKATTLNDKLIIQDELRKKILGKKIDQNNAERDGKLASIGEVKDNDSAAEKEIKQQARANINKEYDAYNQTLTEQSEKQGKLQGYNLELKAYEEYTKRFVEIELKKKEEIEKIQNNTKLNDNEKKERTTKVTQIADMEQSLAKTDAGLTVLDIPTDMMGNIGNILDMSLEEIQARIPIIQKALSEAMKKGADPTAVASKNAELLVLMQRINDLKKDDSGDTAQEKFTKKLKNTQQVMNALGDVIDTVSKEFGDLFGEAGRDAMQTVNTIKGAVTGVISTVLATAQTGEKGIESVEKASVILAIISAAIQVIMALVNIFSKYFSKSAQIQKEIDASKERVKSLEITYKDLELQLKKTFGTNYYKTMSEQINNLEQQTQALNAAVELSKEKEAAAGSDKKKKDAKEQTQELEEQRREAETRLIEQRNQFYEDILTTNLKSYSENLAESIVEGFENGLTDLSDIWDKSFKELMKNMLTKQISIMLQDNLMKVWNTLQASVNPDGTVNKSMLEKAKSEYLLAEQKSKLSLETTRQWMEEMGLNTEESEQKKSEQKGFEAMSQDTASELNARFTALQMSSANIDVNVGQICKINLQMLVQGENLVLNTALLTGIAGNQLDELRIIASHTEVLGEVNKRLRAIDENTRRI